LFKSRDGKAYRRVFDFASMTTKFAKSDTGVALTQVIRQAERNRYPVVRRSLLMVLSIPPLPGAAATGILCGSWNEPHVASSFQAVGGDRLQELEHGQQALVLPEFNAQPP
jgi:hypothetical protein